MFVAKNLFYRCDMHCVLLHRSFTLHLFSCELAYILFIYITLVYMECLHYLFTFHDQLLTCGPVYTVFVHLTLNLVDLWTHLYCVYQHCTCME